MFPAADAAGRAAAIEDNRRAIGEAHALSAQCLVMVCGGLPPGSKDLPGHGGWWRTALPPSCRRRAPPESRWRSSRCTP
jgi:sugar phosphate isomerase/epimerase